MSIKSLFQDIADAIREVEGSSTTYTPTEMPEAIRNITPPITHYLRITVTGGYNGGATINIYYDNIPVFTTTGNSPYNLAYNPANGSFLDAGGNTVNITVNPPATNTSALTINLTGGIIYTSSNIMPNGSNTSYGYNYDSGAISV